MFCPECQYEFREGVTVCPDCGVPLLEELPSKPAAQPKGRVCTERVDLYLVYSTVEPGLLALAKSRMEEAEIRTVVKNEVARGLFGRGSGIEEEWVEIWVRKSDLEGARELLQDLLEDAQHPA